MRRFCYLLFMSFQSDLAFNEPNWCGRRPRDVERLRNRLCREYFCAVVVVSLMKGQWKPLDESGCLQVDNLEQRLNLISAFEYQFHKI